MRNENICETKLKIMRTYLLIATLWLGVFSNPVSAQTFAELFDPKTEVTWLGVDYTITKVIGDKEAWATKSASEMFVAWNQLFVKEQDKYNAARALHRKTVKMALDVTADHNARINAVDFYADDVPTGYALNADNVQSIVNLYDFKNNTGLGMMLIAETYNRNTVQATHWVVIINLGTREVLYTQKILSEPGGMGLRNYWAGSVLGALNKIEKEYKGWQKSAVSYK
jgi:hypothetical protein